MGIISFSVFKDKILEGTKPHTIRARKIPPQINETLYLWWKPRTGEKDFLGVTVCTRIDLITIDFVAKKVLINGESIHDWEIEELAKSDGFDSVDDFWNFFIEPLVGYLIHWNPKFINRSRLRPEVVEHSQSSSDIVHKLPKMYSPSNGTEGMDFCSHWCEMCDRDKNKSKGCHVLMKALVGKTPHWIEHERQGVCTSFVPLKTSSKPTIEQSRKRSLERKGQLNLL
jgi:hypothetical protein